MIRIDKKVLLASKLVAIAVLAIAFALASWGQQAPSAPPAQNRAPQPPAEVHTLKVQGNVYMLVGAGGNITVPVGDDGVLVVDTGLPQDGEKVLAAIRQLSDKPIRWIINTHIHADHTGGNEVVREAGSSIAGGNFAGNILDAGVGANIIATQTILDQMSARGPDGKTVRPEGAWPTDTYFNDRKDMFFNSEGIEILHPHASHTDGDSMVWFRRSDVISTGDNFVTTSYPIIDLQHGGTLNGIIQALNQVIAVTIVRDKQEGGTMVIPGHGRLCDQADVVEYRDMVTIIRDRIQDMIKRGLSLEQVKEARPSMDYDARYGSESGFWTTDKFIEAAYKTLSQTPTTATTAEGASGTAK